MGRVMDEHGRAGLLYACYGMRGVILNVGMAQTVTAIFAETCPIQKAVILSSDSGRVIK